MGRIQVLSDHVANQIAAGEVVERPASVVKELLENSLDAGAKSISVRVEGGGKKLIEITDDGCGMIRDDSLLAFERHATSKLKSADDLLNISTLGFRGEALPSIAAVSRLRLETRSADDAQGTVIEIAGGRILSVEDAGLPQGTRISIRDLFFNIPARRKFLRSESTELSHIAGLVTHYALAHPEMSWRLETSTATMLEASPVASSEERIYQIFGRETLDQLAPMAAELSFDRVGLPQPPPWRKPADAPAPEPGMLRLRGMISKPELQKLNRNSIYIFVNGRLIRDRLILHALTEAYRNIIPPQLFPVALLFIEMPYGEVDVNVHPSKTEVRFRQQSFVHDFVRDSVRAALMKARPAPSFTTEISAAPTAGSALTPGARAMNPEDAQRWASAPTPGGGAGYASYKSSALGGPISGPTFAERIAAQHEIMTPGADFTLRADEPLATPQALPFGEQAFALLGNAAGSAVRIEPQSFEVDVPGLDEVVPESRRGCSLAVSEEVEAAELDLSQLATLKPLGQLRDSFILAVNPLGLWIIDQHVAHERVLFEKVMRQRMNLKVEAQRLLMPRIVELTPAQMALFAEIADELERNGFEAELFGARSIAVKTVPIDMRDAVAESMLHELLEELEGERQRLNIEHVRRRICATIACHAAIKVNMPLDQAKMEWLLLELSKTRHPMSCPHGRPVVLRYSVKDILKAFKRI